jgi:hypothetical protein
VEHSVGLAEAERAEHDGFGLVAPAGHASSVEAASAGKISRDGADPDVHDPLVRLLRPRQGPARRARHPLRGDLA